LPSCRAGRRIDPHQTTATSDLFWCGNDDILGHRKVAQGSEDLDGDPPPTGAVERIRHDHQEIDVAVGMGFAAGVGAKQNDAAGWNLWAMRSTMMGSQSTAGAGTAGLDRVVGTAFLAR
jgi:hypothetical protein